MEGVAAGQRHCCPAWPAPTAAAALVARPPARLARGGHSRCISICCPCRRCCNPCGWGRHRCCGGACQGHVAPADGALPAHALNLSRGCCSVCVCGGGLGGGGGGGGSADGMPMLVLVQRCGAAEASQHVGGSRRAAWSACRMDQEGALAQSSPLCQCRGCTVVAAFRTRSTARTRGLQVRGHQKQGLDKAEAGRTRPGSHNSTDGWQALPGCPNRDLGAAMGAVGMPPAGRALPAEGGRRGRACWCGGAYWFAGG